MSKSNQRRTKRYRGYKPRGPRQPRLVCPVCNKPLNVTTTAITHRESGKKAHFDCVLKELRKSYQLNPTEELFYLGGGGFGIVERKKRKGSPGFTIKKRFQYEERD